MDLLEKASIILTPTAYNNGEALCVKPDDASGDFDFSRNSAATRVNAQGLVENVQILSSNLVQNGDFSELGAEEVSNGSFSQQGSELLSQPVNLVTDFQNNSGGVIVDADTFTTSGGTLDGIRKTNFLTVGKYYKLVIEGDTTSSGFSIGSLGAGGNEYGTGFGTHYFECIHSGLWIRQQTSGTTNITSFSIVEVGQDWTFGTGWSVGEDKAVSDGSQTGNSLLQQASILTLNKTYKVSYELIVTSGSIYARLGFSGAGVVRTTSGTFVEYIECAGNTNFDFLANSSFEGSITNISVKEVDPNDYWTSEQGVWTFGDGVANGNGATGSGEELGQNISSGGIVVGDKVKLSFEIKNYVSGSVQVIGILPTSSKSANGIYEYIGEVTSLNIRMRGSSFNGSVTNISVIEITDDTNLPRINYEGFSYQDALGSELIDYSTLTSGSSSWSLVDGLWVYDDTANGYLITPNLAVVVGDTYKVVVDVTIASGNANFRYQSGNGQTRLFDYTDFVDGVNTFTTTVSGVDGFLQRIFVPTSLTDNPFTLNSISIKKINGTEVVPDSGCGSWLFEPQSTNLITYSEDFSQWVKFGSGTGSVAIVTPNYDISPDGTQNASRLQCDLNGGNASNDRSYLKLGGFSGTPFTCTKSLYVKNNLQSEQVFFIGINGNLDKVTLSVSDKWQRLDVSGGVLNSEFRIGIQGGNSHSNVIDIEIYGAQLEEQSYATSYIPTSGTSVTRNQDVCNNGGSLASINSPEGVLYAEIAALADDLTNRVISLSDGTSNERVVLQYSNSTNKIRCFIKSGGGFFATIDKVVSDEKDFHKVAYKYKSGETKLFVDGSLVNTSTNTFSINNLNKLQFANGTATANPFYGKTKAVAVWKEALSDEELTELTTI